MTGTVHTLYYIITIYNGPSAVKARLLHSYSTSFYRHHSTQRAILRFFATQGRHVALIGVKFGTVLGTEDRAKFHPHRCNDKGTDPKTEIFTEILLNFGI